MRVPYKYVNIKHKRGLTFISRILGIAYSMAGVFGISMLIRGDTTLGITCLVIAVGVCIASTLFNDYAKKTAEKYYASHPFELFELFYDEEKTKLGLAYNNKEITREELDAKLAELDAIKAELATEREKEKANRGKSNSLIPKQSLDEGDEETARENSIIPADSFVDEDGDEETFFLEDGEEDTMILEGDADDEETMPLFAFEPPKPEIYLIRNSDGERIDLKGSLFTIGSNAARADYCITSDKRVSRRHATVYLNEKSFYIKDNSKNGTFVNGEKLENEESVHIKDGDTITLADEEFTVHIIQPSGK